MKERESNVLSLLEDRTNHYARKIALGMKTPFGWKELTYDGLGLMSRRLAAYLMNDLGLKRGEKLAILSESKPEYGACVFASVIAGLITVPLDIKLTKYELQSILSDCLPSVMLVSQTYIDKALELQKEIPSLKHIIVMDEHPVNEGLQSIYTIPNNYTCKWRHRSRKSTVFIIYTSGTTGSPKGVETTFGNMLAQLNDLKQAFNKILPRGDVRILSILPMNHLFEMTVGFSTFLNLGFSVYYTHNLKPKDILNVMRDQKINFMIVVPAFLKLLKTGLEAEMKNTSEFSQKMFPILYHFAKFVPSPKLIKGDCLKIISESEQCFDVVYIDPPYYSGVYEAAITAVKDFAQIIILEHVTDVDFAPLELLKQKKYGDKYISFLHTKREENL